MEIQKYFLHKLSEEESQRDAQEEVWHSVNYKWRTRNKTNLHSNDENNFLNLHVFKGGSQDVKGSKNYGTRSDWRIWKYWSKVHFPDQALAGPSTSQWVGFGVLFTALFLLPFAQHRLMFDNYLFSEAILFIRGCILEEWIRLLHYCVRENWALEMAITKKWNSVNV